MIVLNSGGDASANAASNLSKSAVQLEKSLNSLSSGQRISAPADDAGGLAVAMKLAARSKSIDATKVNIQNALSFVQVQDGALKNLAAVVIRIDELRVMCDDVTKSPADIQNYQTEYAQLRDEMLRLALQQFNGVYLFGYPTEYFRRDSSGAALWPSTPAPYGPLSMPLTVHLSEDGAQMMEISRPVLFDLVVLEHKTPATNPSQTDASGKMISDGDGTMDLLHDVEFLTDLSRQALTEQLALVSTMLATNGAEASRLQFALDSLSVNGLNIDGAHSRIMDVDVARESSNLARVKILHEAGMSSLQKANEAMKYILPLLNSTSPGQV